MSILLLEGRSVLAEALTKLPLHLAWGTGDPAWDGEDPKNHPPSTADTQLVNEIGRREITQWQFVVEDENGAITVVGVASTDGSIVAPDVDNEEVLHKFSPSPNNAPTSHVHMVFKFDFGDAPAATIREIAVFANTIPLPGLPPGQKYFTPDQLASPGRAVLMERIPFFNRQPSVQQTFEQVLTI